MSTPRIASATPTPGDRPLRRDAARNRERILEAAGELFARKGLTTTLNDVAHHAGVGVGTVYRHFPDREQLILTLLHARVELLVQIGQAALDDPDPWHGLITAMERGLELQATDRGLRDLVHETPESLQRVVTVRERLFPIIGELLNRCRAAGAVRADIDLSDIPVLQMMLVSLIDASRGVEPEIWRRYLALTMRGIAAEPNRLPPLSVGPLSLEQIDRVMSASPPPPRRG